MSYLTYKLLHVVGVLALFLSLGGLIASRLAPSMASAGVARVFRMIHGIALLLVAVAGFGLMARLGLFAIWPTWIWVKVLVWVALGGGVALLRGSEKSARILLVVFVVLGGVAVWAALVKF